ncbi:MAG TPA: hypothetical protein VES67_08015 [Vicinamibacterales bacterium]|nr:hypothetical protein [Vicinamibacterales bacterium]
MFDLKPDPSAPVRTEVIDAADVSCRPPRRRRLSGGDAKGHGPMRSYVDRMATIGWTDAARRARARLARTAVSIAIAPPAT